MKCATNADCTVSGTVCDTSTGIGVCVATCGDTLCGAGQTCVNNACVDTTCVPACASYQMCNTQANPPACVAVDCSTDCTLTNEVCDLTTFMCVAPTTGTIAIQSPDGGVFGIQTALPVMAKATAPGGPTQVALIVEQGTHAPFIDVASGSNGVYTGAVPLLDAGFTTGTATVTGNRLLGQRRRRGGRRRGRGDEHADDHHRRRPAGLRHREHRPGVLLGRGDASADGQRHGANQ